MFLFVDEGMVVLFEVKFCYKNVVNFLLCKLISIEYV